MEHKEFMQFIGNLRISGDVYPSLVGVKLNRKQYEECTRVINSKLHWNWNNWVINSFSRCLIEEREEVTS